MNHAPQPPKLSPPPLPVRTERLLLRSVLPTDADALRYYTDPEVCRYLPFPPADEPALAARVARMSNAVAPSAPDETLALGVEHAGTLVGDLMLRLRSRADEHSPPAVAELGWVFSPAVAGRGFATEAARALIDLGFQHYPVHRLYANLDPRNQASATLCERLGMTLEAHLRRDYPAPDGTWTDSAIYGLLREEWEAAR